MKIVPTLALALLLALGLSGCGAGLTSGDDGPPVVQSVGEHNTEDGATNSQEYAGRTITLSGPVSQVYADGLFSVAAESNDYDFDPSDNEVLVIAPNAQVNPGQQIEVSGALRVFSVDEAARLAGTAISAEQALALEGKLLIVAESFSATGS